MNMNYDELLRYQDNGMYDGAYRIYNRIKNDALSGIVGEQLVILHSEAYHRLQNLRLSIHDDNLRADVNRWINYLQTYFEMNY